MMIVMLVVMLGMVFVMVEMMMVDARVYDDDADDVHDDG